MPSNAPQPEFAAPLVWRIATAASRRLHALLTRLRYPRAGFGPGCDIRARFVLRQGPAAQVRFGEACVLDNDFTIECLGRLFVGRRVIFGHHCTLAAREQVEIGDDCMLAELVSIRDHDHTFSSGAGPYREQGFVCVPVRIGRNVWLGGKVTICKGVSIGDNSVIGANAVVTKDIPANCVAGGVPARVIRQLALVGPGQP